MILDRPFSLYTYKKKTQKNYKNKKMKPAFVRILTVSVLFIIISQGA